MPSKKKIKKPVVIFCELRRPADEIVNISSQNGAEGVVTKMLPKSHVSHVILNANVSEDRFLGMKVSTENKMQKKSKDVHDHFINTFVKRLERKQQRWIKEDNYVSKNLQHTTTGRGKHFEPPETIGALALPTPPQPQVLYRKAKYPYVGVSRFPKFEQPSTARRETFPRIQTVPVGRSRPTTNQGETRVKFPTAHPPKTQNGASWNGVTTNQRADTASTILTRATRPRSRRRLASNHDNRFIELMSWLSPIDAQQGPIFSRSRVTFGLSQRTF